MNKDAWSAAQTTALRILGWIGISSATSGWGLHPIDGEHGVGWNMEASTSPKFGSCWLWCQTSTMLWWQDENAEVPSGCDAACVSWSMITSMYYCSCGRADNAKRNEQQETLKSHDSASVTIKIRGNRAGNFGYQTQGDLGILYGNSLPAVATHLNHQDYWTVWRDDEE